MGSSKRQRKLQQAERRLGTLGTTAEDETDQEHIRQKLVEAALHANRCGHGEEAGMHPLFEVHEDGAVTATFDGKPLTHWRQVAGESHYWLYVHMAPPFLIHDEEHHQFRSVYDGELVHSRDHLDLPAYGRAQGAWLRRRDLVESGGSEAGGRG